MNLQKKVETEFKDKDFKAECLKCLLEEATRRTGKELTSDDVNRISTVATKINECYIESEQIVTDIKNRIT